MNDLAQHFIHQRGVGTARQGGLLRLAHFRGRHHLHGFGDLRGVFDRFDSAAYVARAGHGLVQSPKSKVQSRHLALGCFCV